MKFPNNAEGNRRLAPITCLVSLLSLLMFIVTSQATAHSGGTDAYGCHAGSQPYHCHTPKTPSYDDYSEPSYPRKRYRPDPQVPFRQDPIDPNSPTPKNKVTAFYDKITGSIAYGLNLIRKKPQLVKSCEEWVMVMKLMTTIVSMTPKLLATLERKCYETGHQRFGKHMRKRIERLPIRLSD